MNRDQTNCSRMLLTSSAAARRAFTLLETLVVVLLSAVLLALLLPSLAGVRGLTDQRSIVAAMRSHATNFSMYVSDHADAYPHYMDPTASHTLLRFPDHEMRLRYFGAFAVWQIALFERYYDEAWNHPTFFDPATYRKGFPHASYFTSFDYSSTFNAAPAFWNPRTRTGPEQWRGVRGAEVLFPSSKALLVHRHTVPGVYYEDGQSFEVNEVPPGNPGAIALVDGSARWLMLSSLARGYRGGDGNWPGSQIHGAWPGMHTIDGVRGRDIE